MTDREKRLLATIRGWGDKEIVRRARRVGGGPSVARHEGPSELVVDAGSGERLKSLRTARKKEAEATRDQ